MREKWRWRIRAIFHSPRITAFTASPAPTFRGLVNKQRSRLPQPFPAEALAGLSRAMRGALSNPAWRLDIPLSSRHSLAMKLLFIQRR
jgi:hypothetical protein